MSGSTRRSAPLLLALVSGLALTSCSISEISRGRSADDRDLPPSLAEALRTGKCLYVVEHRTETRIFFVRVKFKQSFKCSAENRSAIGGGAES